MNTCTNCTLAPVCGQWKLTNPMQAKSCSKQREYGCINPPPSAIIDEAIAYRTRMLQEGAYLDEWSGSEDGIYDFNVWLDTEKNQVAVAIYPVITNPADSSQVTTDTSEWYTVDPAAFNDDPSAYETEAVEPLKLSGNMLIIPITEEE